MGAVMGRYPIIEKLELNDYQMTPQTVNCGKSTQERSTVEMVAGALIVILLSIIMGMVIQGKGSSQVGLPVGASLPTNYNAETQKEWLTFGDVTPCGNPLAVKSLNTHRTNNAVNGKLTAFPNGEKTNFGHEGSGKQTYKKRPTDTTKPRPNESKRRGDKDPPRKLPGKGIGGGGDGPTRRRGSDIKDLPVDGWHGKVMSRYRSRRRIRKLLGI
jgi:hypothetical protein